jgi:hypothetical protein
MSTRASSARYRKEQAERGLCQAVEWIPAERRAELAAFAAHLRGEKTGTSAGIFQPGAIEAARAKQDAELERLARTLAEGDISEFNRLLASGDLQRLADWSDLGA